MRGFSPRKKAGRSLPILMQTNNLLPLCLLWAIIAYFRSAANAIGRLEAQQASMQGRVGSVVQATGMAKAQFIQSTRAC